MNQLYVSELKAAFLDWSGGFPPESPDQITVYIDYGMSVEMDPVLARQALEAWMQEEETPQNPQSGREP